MTTPRRALLASPALLAFGHGPARAQWAPSRSIRLVVGFTPAGTTDIAARILAERLTQRLGQSVLVENRPGAGGNLGAEVVSKAEPDGHTLLMTTVSSGAINFPLYGRRMPIRPEDLAAVGLLLRVPNAIFVANAVPANSLAELVALLRARPGQLNIGSSGIGTSLHMTGELLKLATGVQVTHVPFRGSGPMLQEMIAGRIELGVDNLPSVIGHLREGRLRPLAVTTATRSPALPGVPTTTEAGFPAIEATAWFGLQAPARTPAPIIQRLGAEVNAAVADPATWAKLADLGGMKPDLQPDGGTNPDAFETFIRAEIAKWTEVVQRSGASVEG
jgi:tripartite-type tricarboxylate transporter receptor subunit TctC